MRDVIDLCSQMGAVMCVCVRVFFCALSCVLSHVYSHMCAFS